MSNSNPIFETSDSRLAAAIFTLGHCERQIDPCIWFRDGERETCKFFFENFGIDSGAELAINDIAEAWEDRNSEQDALDKLLALIPDEHRDEAIKLWTAGKVATLRQFSENYKHHTMALLNRSKQEVGMSIQRRGNRVLFAGRHASKESLDELRREARF